MICVINHKKVQNLVHKLAHCRMSTILSLYYGSDRRGDSPRRRGRAAAVRGSVRSAVGRSIDPRRGEGEQRGYKSGHLINSADWHEVTRPRTHAFVLRAHSPDRAARRNSLSSLKCCLRRDPEASSNSLVEVWLASQFIPSGTWTIGGPHRENFAHLMSSWVADLG